MINNKMINITQGIYQSEARIVLLLNNLPENWWKIIKPRENTFKIKKDAIYSFLDKNFSKSNIFQCFDNEWHKSVDPDDFNEVVYVMNFTDR